MTAVIPRLERKRSRLIREVRDAPYISTRYLPRRILRRTRKIHRLRSIGCVCPYHPATKRRES